MFVLYCLKVQIDRLTYTLPLKLVQAAAPLEAPTNKNDIYYQVKEASKILFILFFSGREGY